MTVANVRRLHGTVVVPGDKSISHRALILGAMSEGTQRIQGISPADDVAATSRCLRALGARFGERDGVVTVTAGTARDADRLDAGNSGTTARLLCGFAAARGIRCTIDGDASLRRRPMRRVTEPLSQMGADIDAAPDGTLPVRIAGGVRRAIRYELPVASAQVKSAILIAGLGAPGETTVVEPVPTRDHTERMLVAMGVPLRRNGREITVSGPAVPRAIETRVPGDFSSAAFILAAAAAVPGSEVTVAGVGVNPGRTGLLEVLERMGCAVVRTNERADGGEPVADLTVAARPLRAVTIDDPTLLAALIDEVPAIAVLATRAEGTTVIRGASELRRKESDRIAALAANLGALGADIEELADGLRITGSTPLAGGAVSSFGDHRMAMAMAVAGLVAAREVEIDDAAVVAVSYPGFFDDVHSLCDPAGGSS